MLSTGTRVVLNLPGIWVRYRESYKTYAGDLDAGTRVVHNVPTGSRVKYPPSGAQVLPASSRGLYLF